MIPPKYAVNKVEETIKKNTSRSLRRIFVSWKKYIGTENAFGGKGYLVLTVGINEEVLRVYVESQEEEETGQAQLEFWKYHICKGVWVFLVRLAWVIAWQ